MRMKLLQTLHPETDPMLIQFLDLSHKPKQYDIVEFYPDCSFKAAQNRLIKTRKQVVDGHTFVVCSIFERGASQTAADKLRGLVEREAEKDCRSAL